MTDSVAQDLTPHLPALHWAIPRMVEEIRARGDYPVGMGARFFDLLVMQSMSEVFGAMSTMSGYWVAGYWPRFRLSAPPDKQAQAQMEFGMRTVCHVGHRVVSCQGVAPWAEFRQCLLHAARGLCQTRGLSVGLDQFILVNMQVNAFSISGGAADTAGLRLRHLLDQYRAEQQALELSTVLPAGPATEDRRRL